MTYILGRRRTARPLVRRLPRLLRYAVRIVLDQEGLLFQPVDRPPLEADELAADASRVPLAVGASGAAAWWIPANPAGPLASSGTVILVFPRATGDPRDETETLRSFRQMGCSSLVVDYSRSKGQKPPRLAHCRSLARAAWKHLREDRGLAPPRVVLYGRSLGAAFAAELGAEITRESRAEPVSAATPPALLGGLIAHNGFSSVADLARDSFPSWMVALFQRVDLDPVREVAAGAGPVLVVFAQDDQLIPPSHSERILATAGERGQSLRYPGDHLSEGWLQTRSAQAALRRFLDGAEP